MGLPERKRIVVFGPFAQSNLGDVLVTGCVLETLGRRHEQIVTFSLYCPNQRQDQSPRTAGNRVVPLTILTRWNLLWRVFQIGYQILRAELVVERAVYQDFGRLRAAISEIGVSFLFAAWARILKKPYFFIGSAYGPVETAVGKWLANKSLGWARSVCLRDGQSHRLVTERIAPESQKTADVVFYNPPLTVLPRHSSRLLSVNMVPVESLGYAARPSNALLRTCLIRTQTKAEAKGLETKLFGMTAYDQRLVSEFEQIDRLPRFDLLTSVSQLQSLFSQSLLLVVSRYHAFIAALLTRTPCLVCAYHDKVRNLVEETHWNAWSLDYRNLSENALWEQIEFCIQSKEMDKMRDLAQSECERLRILAGKNYGGLVCAE